MAAPTEEQALSIINDLIRYKDLLEEIVQVMDDWGSMDQESLIVLIGEGARLTGEDMPEDSWLQQGVVAYQEKIAERWQR